MEIRFIQAIMTHIIPSYGNKVYTSNRDPYNPKILSISDVGDGAG